VLTRLLVAGAIALSMGAGGNTPVGVEAEGELECVFETQYGTCQLTAESPIYQQAHEPDDNDGGDTAPASTEDEPECTHLGRTIPCETGYGLWSQEDHCYLQPASPQPPQSSDIWDGHQGGVILDCRWSPGMTEVDSGQTVPGAMVNDPVWAPDPPDAADTSPVALARQAVEQMNLQAGQIGTTPLGGGESVVGVPTWLWVANPSENTTGPITRSATAGATTVTATATLEEITYEMGDGQTITCAGQDAPGTAYQESFGASESPTCGYTYSQPSPEGGYTITATSHWSIEWDGGGQSGTFTTDFTATTGYQVGELQALRGASE